MPRSIRIEFAGAFYHVMARGNRREAIFLDDEDRRLFVQTLGEACAMTGWRVHGWVLLSNHYHLMIETPEPNLVAGMQWLQNTVTRRFNVRHRAWGRVFGDRYKAVSVEQRAQRATSKHFDIFCCNSWSGWRRRPSAYPSPFGALLPTTCRAVV